MSKIFTFTKSTELLFIIIALALSIGLLQTAPIDSSDSEDISVDDEVQAERRTDALKQLRHFLLTSNAEQRAAKREKQNFYKRELVRQYSYTKKNSSFHSCLFIDS